MSSLHDRERLKTIIKDTIELSDDRKESRSAVIASYDKSLLDEIERLHATIPALELFELYINIAKSGKDQPVESYHDKRMTDLMVSLIGKGMVFLFILFLIVVVLLSSKVSMLRDLFDVATKVLINFL